LPKRKPLGTIRREFDPLGGFSEEDKMKPVWRRDRGQGLAEYALILVLIAIVAIVALVFLGNQISSIFNQIGQSI
jgi:pilus assembly protein Flp/PilA